jgi:hypothetical protein
MRPRASLGTPPRSRRTTSLDTASPHPLTQELELRRGERETDRQEREVRLDNERGNKRTREEEEIRREEKKGKKKEKIDYQPFTNYIDNYIN